MKKTIKIISIIIVALFSLSLFTNTPAFAANPDICDNPNVSNEVKAAAGCHNQDSADLPVVIGNILSSIIGILGIVAVIFIIVGGVNYMTSAGDSTKLQKAKNTILYAVIGLIICALAFGITNFTIGIINNANNSSSSSASTNP